MPIDIASLPSFLSERLGLLIAEANEAGYGSNDVLEELARQIASQGRAYQEDPDPAEDPDLEAARAATVRNPGQDNLDSEQSVPPSA